MRWKPMLGALLFVAGVSVGVPQLLGGVASVTLLVVGIAAGWLLVPGFWRNAVYGAVAGLAAGLLVLGPGLRLAMRLVAILDPGRSPEFTIEGTLFIVIAVGAVMGGIFGLIGNIARVGFGIPTRIAGLVPALMVGLLIGLDTELRSEVVELGAGPWLNIPMFAAVALGYGVLWTRVVTTLDKRRTVEKERDNLAEVPR